MMDMHVWFIVIGKRVFWVHSLEYPAGSDSRIGKITYPLPPAAPFPHDPLLRTAPARRHDPAPCRISQLNTLNRRGGLGGLFGRQQIRAKLGRRTGVENPGRRLADVPDHTDQREGPQDIVCDVDLPPEEALAA